MWFNVNHRILKDNWAAQIQEGLRKLMKLSLADKIAIAMFVLGMAFALAQKVYYQAAQENSIAELAPQQIEVIEPAS